MVNHLAIFWCTASVPGCQSTDNVRDACLDFGVAVGAEESALPGFGSHSCNGAADSAHSDIEFLLLGIEFDPNFQSGGKQLLTYQVYDAGRLIAQGPFEVDVSPAHFANGSDEFVNYCIDQSQPVYSSNGQLSCNVPASYTVSFGWS